jgi:aspartate aminotransferase
LEVRRAVADYVRNTFSFPAKAELIYMTAGASSSLTISLNALAEPGDEVIVFTPYFPEYRVFIEKTGAKFVPVASAEKTFQLDAQALQAAVNEHTKAVIVNSPNNPTGAVYSLEELKAIAKVCEEKGIIVISDEIYEKLVYAGEKHYSIASLSDYMKEHTVVVNGMSKSYSMTGWRIGYIGAPKAIAKAVSSMQSHTTSNACSISQYASMVALTDPEGVKFIDDMQKIFDERRIYMLQRLQKMENVICIEPKGAFYVFVDITNFIVKEFDGVQIEGSLSFADAALKKGVALIPGVAFGDDKSIRLSYAISLEDIKEGLNRFEEFIKEIK